LMMSEVPLYTLVAIDEDGKPVPLRGSKHEPHGRLRPFNQKSTCLPAIDFRAVSGTDVVT
jgi:hypothetical protein